MGNERHAAAYAAAQAAVAALDASTSRAAAWLACDAAWAAALALGPLELPWEQEAAGPAAPLLGASAAATAPEPEPRPRFLPPARGPAREQASGVDAEPAGLALPVPESRREPGRAHGAHAPPVSLGEELRAALSRPEPEERLSAELAAEAPAGQELRAALSGREPKDWLYAELAAEEAEEESRRREASAPECLACGGLGCGLCRKTGRQVECLAAAGSMALEATAICAAAEADDAWVAANSLPRRVEEHLSWKSKAYSLLCWLRSASENRASEHLTGAGPHSSPPFTIESTAAALDELCWLLDALGQRLRKLREDLDCLDDGVAESLFNTQGKLRRDVQRIDRVCRKCTEQRAGAFVWSQVVRNAPWSGMDIIDLADFIEEAMVSVDKLYGLCASFEGRRRAAVARARAAIEIADADHRASAGAMLSAAMEPSRNVDFPCITEICERLTEKPSEVPSAVHFLVAVLGEPGGLRRKLKALTIAHEMLYDERMLQELAAADGVLRPLQALRQLPAGSGLGAAVEDNVRMLATEVERRLSSARGPLRPARSRPAGLLQQILSRGLAAAVSSGADLAKSRARAVTDGEAAQHGLRAPWAGACLDPAPWQGDGAGPSRGRAGARRLAAALRSGGRRQGSLPEGELAVLDDAFETLAGLAEALGRLHDELDCLDDGTLGLPFRREREAIQMLLLAASKLQERCEAWRVSLSPAGGPPARPAGRAARPGAVPLGAALECIACGNAGCSLCRRPSPTSPPSAPPARRPPGEHMADLLEEALAAIDELHRRRLLLSELRHFAVQNTKAAIEAAGQQLPAGRAVVAVAASERGAPQR